MTRQEPWQRETRHYAEQWQKEGWSGRGPNRDEADRWRALEPLARRALAAVPQPRVLDLGCGRGWLTNLLRELPADAVGADPVPASVDAARALFPDLPFHCATAGDLARQGLEGHFHLVVSSEVLEHVPDTGKAAFLADVRSLLAPGGHLLLTTPRGELWSEWRRRASRTQPVEEWVDEPGLAALARAAGFAVVRQTRAHLPSAPFTWHGRLLKRVLLRRPLRRLPLGAVRRWLEHRARFYQVALLRREDS